MSLRFPELGETLPVRASPETLELLATRRSSPAQTLGAPGPSPEELELLLRLAVRTPDHGKLSPWRFLVFEPDAKRAYVAELTRLARSRDDAEVATSKLAKFAGAPLTVAVISHPVAAPKVPQWEQILSAGAVCMNLLVAAEALGYGANWITDWYAYDDQALTLLRLEPGERVAGFLHIGTPPESPLERVRPDIGLLTRYWTA